MNKKTLIRCLGLLVSPLVVSLPLFASTSTVTSLSGGTNTGSLYAAIAAVNASSDTNNAIVFSTNGTISLSTILPSIQKPVVINGFSAPGWSNLPVISIDFNATPGLLLAPGSHGSSVNGLSLINAPTPGVTLQSSGNSFYGNSIESNYGSGISIEPGSVSNLISYTQNFMSTNINYYNATNITPTVSYWQGIRGSATTNAYLSSTTNYLICGTSDNTNGLLFIGNIEGTVGSSFVVNNPAFTAATSVYGPDFPENGLLRLVGSGNSGGKIYGFIFEGATNDFTNPSSYTTVDFPNSDFNYVHSTMGNLAVGNAGNTNIVTESAAFIYDVTKKSFVTTIVYPGSLTDSAYGIWWNGGSSYTICGGYSTNLISHTNQEESYGSGFLVDYDSSLSGTNAFTHWTSFNYPGTNFLTHFEGISSARGGYYTLVANSSLTATSPPQGSFVAVPRQADGSFGTAKWIDMTYPSTNTTSANSVYGTNIVGVVAPTTAPFSIQATIYALDVENNINNNIGSGISIKSSGSNLINACTLNSNTAYGIFGFGNCTSCQLIGNDVSNNTLGDYNLMHSTGIIVLP